MTFISRNKYTIMKYEPQVNSPSTSYVWPLCDPLIHCLYSTYKELKMSLNGVCCRCLQADNTSVTAKIACMFTTVSAVLYIIAFSSTQWVTGSERRETVHNMTDLQIGLWKTCYTPVNDDRLCVQTKHFLTQDWNDEWLPGVQTMLCLGLVLQVFTTVDIWLYVTVPILQTGLSTLYLAGCSSFATAALCFLGVLIFGIQHTSDTANFQDTDLNWSYGTMVLSFGCTLLSYILIMCDFYAVLFLKAKKKSRKKQARQRVLNALDEAVIENQNSDPPSQSERGQYSAQGSAQDSAQDSDEHSVSSQAALCSVDGNQDNNHNNGGQYNEGQNVLQSQTKHRGSQQAENIGSKHNGRKGFKITHQPDRNRTNDADVVTDTKPANESNAKVPVQLFQAK